jgi:hypothetical protein
MTQSKPIRVSVYGAALLVGLTVLGATRSAGASSRFPPLLQQALETHFPGQTFCVPQCTVCHQTNTGGFGTLNAFGLNLKAFGGLYGTVGPNTDPNVALPNYFAAVAAGKTNGDSDGDGISDEAELKALSSPAVPDTRGDGLVCPDIAYGCGARIAPAPPPVDRIGLFSAGFVILGLAAFRRFRRVRAS